MIQGMKMKTRAVPGWLAMAGAVALLAACAADRPPPSPAQQCLNLGHSPTSQSYIRCMDRIAAERAAKKTE